MNEDASTSLFVVAYVDLAHLDMDTCCYCADFDSAYSALVDYALATIRRKSGLPMTEEVAFDDEWGPDVLTPGWHGRIIDDDSDESPYPRAEIWQVQKGEAMLEYRFEILRTGKYVEDFLNEVTPAVEALAADDTTPDYVYEANKPGGFADLNRQYGYQKAREMVLKGVETRQKEGGNETKIVSKGG